MKSSELYCFGNGSLYFLPINFVITALRDLCGGCSHEQRKQQDRRCTPDVGEGEGEYFSNIVV